MEPSLDRAMVQSESSGRLVAVAGTVVLVADRNPRRVALVFAVMNGKGVRVHTDPNMDGTGGFIVFNLVPPLMLTLAQHGDLVRRPWYAIQDATATTLAVYETESSAP